MMMMTTTSPFLSPAHQCQQQAAQVAEGSVSRLFARCIIVIIIVIVIIVIVIIIIVIIVIITVIIIVVAEMFAEDLVTFYLQKT